MDGAGLASRRGVREWLVDTALFLAAVAFGLLTAAARVELGPPVRPGWLFDVDQLIGALGCAALWLRRRWPVALALVLIALSVFAEMSGGAMLAALFTVAVHRSQRTTMILFALGIAASFGFVLLRPDPDVPGYVLVLFSLAMQGAVVGWGRVIHHRRQLVVSLRDRAARAEAEAHLRAEQAQHRAREDIAREMHDVLGHRLSLLSVHAGALEYRPDAPAEDVARAAAVIRDSAHHALQDLREVIGVLRAPVGELPQPTLADMPQLVTESRQAGMRVVLRQEVTGSVPDRLGRTAYRIVQEGLTNARKHAWGTEVTVTISGAPEDGLTVEVGNGPRTPPASGAAPGQGLIGLAERVALAEGRLEHGPTEAGGWRLATWLPWPP
ncbi:sensor histidine kinase [Amycolatopsis cihanbeyliensis]|uniref:histidine kinase n=1 Tax=Amycolatopsis cihanbeyliensis TaxID=1128664 RepID=A0A542CUL9_AMYCI|nr:histidine kinase [Amycolatopsis cihanbeyliensis]TQI94513.1 signal transduction histidine kinase [Amycolatopsis cihanbeyliensis]